MKNSLTPLSALVVSSSVITSCGSHQSEIRNLQQVCAVRKENSKLQFTIFYNCHLQRFVLMNIILNEHIYHLAVLKCFFMTTQFSYI